MRSISESPRSRWWTGCWQRQGGPFKRSRCKVRGSSREFLVANFDAYFLAVFFPNWVARESAISKSPLRFEGLDFKLSNWTEVAELDRGHLRHKVWVRLHYWPILCWNEENVKAAVSGFGELWEIDPLSERRVDVSFFRANVRCQDVHSIPEVLNLMVDDRRFRIPVEIELSEDANPILLSEDLDERLGLESSDAQDRFIRLTGFNSIPAQGSQDWPRDSRDGARSVLHRHRSTFFYTSGVYRLVAPAAVDNLNSNSSELPPRCTPGQSQVVPQKSLGPGSCEPSTGPSASASRPPSPGGPPTSASRPPSPGGPSNSGGPPTSASRSPSPGGPFTSESRPPSAGGTSFAEASPLGPALGVVGLADAEPDGPRNRLNPGTFQSGVSPLASIKLGSFRRSLRLVSKNMGIKKDSLQRAQDIMCSKLKSLKISYSSSRSFATMPAQPSLLAPSSVVLLKKAPNVLVANEEVTRYLLRLYCRLIWFPHFRGDTALPLTEQEILKILTSCGISNREMGPPREPVSAPLEAERAVPEGD
uniref:Uncharacterized protein n=1 Tax=Ananas comosus var. bracteatus TaxID=296719 RepID=A0A6V7QCX0_ANACO|nr:unnamed protein product [Ananas comosus var. bracteatus]